MATLNRVVWKRCKNCLTSFMPELSTAEPERKTEFCSTGCMCAWDDALGSHRECFWCCQQYLVGHSTALHHQDKDQFCSEPCVGKHTEAGRADWNDHGDDERHAAWGE